jgi:hypothetical protein
MTKLLNLTLHCGSHEAKLADVRNVKTPTATETWCPIGHDELIDSVIGTLGGSGLRVVHEAHALWQDGNRYFGSFQLQNGCEHDDYALVIGLRNSHDKTFPAGLACGAGVFVCDNLSFSGEVTLSRRHTVRIREDLPRLITMAVGRLGTMKVNQERRIDAYKVRSITDQEAHDVMVRAIDVGAVPVTLCMGCSINFPASRSWTPNRCKTPRFTAGNQLCKLCNFHQGKDAHLFWENRSSASSSQRAALREMARPVVFQGVATIPRNLFRKPLH